MSMVQAPYGSRGLQKSTLTQIKDQSTLYERDRLAWCLHHLHWTPHTPVDHSIILQHLDAYFKSNPAQAKRLDTDLYRCLSNVVAIEQLLSILDLHRPALRAPLVEEFLEIDRQSWQTIKAAGQDPYTPLAADLKLGSLFEPLGKFAMPSGKKDEIWLEKRDFAHDNLRQSWTAARHWHLKTQTLVPSKHVQPQVDLMSQCEALEHRARLKTERCEIQARLEVARTRAVAKQFTPLVENLNTSPTHVESKVRIQHSEKEKVKTRPQQSSEVKDEVTQEHAASDAQTASPTPTLYSFTKRSKTWKVLRLMFPQPEEDTTDGPRKVDWQDFVSTMSNLGLDAEPRGGSIFTFRGEIKVPSDEQVQKHSLNIHRPHPDPSMSYVKLRALGSRLNRRFGWVRECFGDGGS